MIAALSLHRFLPTVLLPAALLALSACNVSGLQISSGGYEPYGSYGSGYGYGYGYGAPSYEYGYGVPAYRVAPRGYWGYPDYRAPSRYGWGSSRAHRSYANNGRCDDARYRTSNGGRAAPGTDERDCRRYGDGRK